MSDGDRIQQLERKMRWLAICVCGLVLYAIFATALRAQEKATPVATPSDAVGWALADIATMPSSERPFQRYVWIPPWGDPSWIGATNWAVSTAASHSQVIQLGQVLANGWMLRYDLRRLCPKVEQLAKLISTWDQLAIEDPYFHVPVSNSGVKAAVLAPHLEQPAAVALSGLSASGGAIYRADWLLFRMLSTLEGGRYYDFLQVERRPKNGTAQAVWLASLGVYEAETQKLTADQRSAIFRSGVTGKPRRTDVFYGLGRGGNIVSVTHDLADEDINVRQHPIRNLLAFADRAREIIVQRPNGTHAFALFDGNGALQDSVPDNIARDTTVPGPHTARLQPAISCIRCHGPHDGWQPLGNDVTKVLASGLDVFSDLADAHRSRVQIVDTLVSLYAGDLDAADGPLGRARRDYLSTTFRIVGGPRLNDAGPKPTSVVAKVSEDIGRIYASYRYDLVTPERAALELGTKGGTINDALGPPIAGTAVDPIIGTLRAGVSVNRADWETVYGDAALAANSFRKPGQK